MHHSRLSRLILVLLLATMLSPLSTQAGNPGQNSVAQLTGTVDVINSGVQLMKSGTENWLNITIESVIARGDRVRTNDTGVALLTWFEDGTTMEVGPSSELVIDEFSGDEDRFVIEASLLQGSLFSSVRRLLDPESRYQVLTPSVSATVRGTIFGVYVDDDLNSAVAVTDGTVNVAGYDDIDNAVDVEEGNFVAVGSDGDFQEVVDIDEAGEQFTDFVDAMVDFDERAAAAHDEEVTTNDVTTDDPGTEETSSLETTDDGGGGPPDHSNAGGTDDSNSGGTGDRAEQANENANNPNNREK